MVARVIQSCVDRNRVRRCGEDESAPALLGFEVWLVELSEVTQLELDNLQDSPRSYRIDSIGGHARF